jgi:predicted CopG family antitoxin
MKVSVKIEDDVQTELVKVSGEYQVKTGRRFSISETIRELIKEHKKEA